MASDTRERSCSSALGKADSTSHATNALDHSADPFTISSNMVAVVRPGGVVILRHKRNEGEERALLGDSTQSNFDVADNSLLLWNNVGVVNVGSALAERAATSAWIAQNEVVARLRAHESES